MSFKFRSARGRAVAIVVWLAAAAHPALAQSQGDPVPSPLGPLPPGWSVAITDVIAVFSPPASEGSVTIVAPPVLTAQGEIKSAIVENAPSLIEDLFGAPRPAGEPIPLPASAAVAPGLLVPLLVELEDGSEARIEATGYPLTGRRLQLFLVASPATMSDDTPALRQARTLVDQWRAANVIVNQNLSAAPAGPAAPQRTEDGQDPASAPAASAPPTTPDDSVENVIFFLRYRFDGANPSVGGEPVTVTALLLKDGRVFENEARAPSEFDPATRPPGSPGVGRWQRDGEAYALAFADGTQGTAVAGAAKTLPATGTMSLTGRYTAIGSASFTTLLSETIEFYPDGSLLLKDQTKTLSGTYSIYRRTMRVNVPGQPPSAMIFGFRGSTTSPSTLVIGNRLYEHSGDR
jgi:hypothetical protein